MVRIETQEGASTCFPVFWRLTVRRLGQRLSPTVAHDLGGPTFHNLIDCFGGQTFFQDKITWDFNAPNLYRGPSVTFTVM